MLQLKTGHKVVKDYYQALENLGQMEFFGEGAVSPAFAALLRHCAQKCDLTLVEQYGLKRQGRTLRVDGALLDPFKIPHGYWEAKDTADDLDKEIRHKLAAGYPQDNILFQAPHRAVLYQNGREFFRGDISRPEPLVEALRLFFDYRPPEFERWDQAVKEFQGKLPDLARGLLALLREERCANPDFARAFADFAALCRQALNPNLADAAVEEMVIQHLLTERLFRQVFENPDFAQRNIIAREIEKVIEALTSRSFSRREFLRSLDRFYLAIETTARGLDDWSQKQGFLNTVYERFFQGFSVKAADTHGIVYTPQPLVDFMVRSVAHLLEKEFGRSLADEGVHIMDPFVGTGNFLLRVMREIPRHRLEHKYAHELHANEVMLLPYYIAALNLEHEYYDLTGAYRPFEGLCLVDTFELAEARQPSLFLQENLERVELQKKTPIFVIIGNPPYNAGQVNENDNNKNRKYPVIDKRVSETYGKASKATLVRKLNDPYIKAIRWATDRVKDEGIIAFVTNSSFISEITFDGMRKHLAQDFDVIYILDLGGNVRKNPKLSGSTHNVFGIQVGVCICFFIKKNHQVQKSARIFYASVGRQWRKEEKYTFLEDKQQFAEISWQPLVPDKNYTWLREGLQGEFEEFLPLGTKIAKKGKENAIFMNFGPGILTARDGWAYNYNLDYLSNNIKKLIDTYNDHVAKWIRLETKTFVDDFVVNDDKKISWTYRLKNYMTQKANIEFDISSIRQSIYRPFVKQYLYFNKYLNERRYQMPVFFTIPETENENKVICVSQSSEKPFSCLMSNRIVNFVMCGGFGAVTQCFPFYTYGEDGGNRRENLTDWALGRFRGHYQDDALGKWDIFHYIYALLHHPEYRGRYAANLRRELPRIPFAPDFWGLARAGAALAELHVDYEAQPEHPLTWVENPQAPLDFRVGRMKLSKDRTAVVYNDYLTLTGLPHEVFDYKLGNRSALEWVIDQYRLSTDKRSGIISDPNRADDPRYIVRLLTQVVHVSLQTLKIIRELPPL